MTRYGWQTVLFVCEALSLSARQNLVIEKGPYGPSFLIINSASIKDVHVPFIEFLPFLHRQGLLFAPMSCRKGVALFRR
jgi:hypothetical protein